MAKQKKPEPKKPNKNDQFLRNLEQEDQMHDDHGPAIIGLREKKPVLPKEEEK